MQHIMCLYISLQTWIYLYIYIYTYFEDSVHFPLLSCGTGRNVSCTEKPTPPTQTLILLWASVCDRLAPGRFLKPKMLSRWWNSQCLLSLSLNQHTVLENMDEVVSLRQNDFVVGLICGESMWFFILLVLFFKREPKITDCSVWCNGMSRN